MACLEAGTTVFSSAVLAGSVIWLAGCSESSGQEPCDLPPYAIQVDVQIPFDIGTQGVVVHWADQVPADGAVGPEGFGVASLRREFGTRAEAESFQVPFVVLVGGQQSASGEVDFAACDFVAELGQEPLERTQAVFRYRWDEFGTLGPGSNYAFTPMLACVTTTAHPGVPEQILWGCSGSQRHLVLYLPVDSSVTMTETRRDGELIAPRTIGRWGSGVLLELDLQSETSTPAAAVSSEVGVRVDGAPEATIVVDFDACLDQSISVGKDPDSLVYQRRTLTLEDGTLAIDEWSGLNCMWADGTGLSVSP